MNVKYVGQLSPACHALSQLPEIWRVFITFLYGQILCQKQFQTKENIKNGPKIKYQNWGQTVTFMPSFTLILPPLDI